MREFIGGKQVIQADKVLRLPQQIWGKLKRSYVPCRYDNGRKCTIYIGTWLKVDAFAIAEELRRDKFSVKLRPRGQHRYNLFVLPMHRATHAAVYISGVISHARGEY